MKIDGTSVQSLSGCLWDSRLAAMMALLKVQRVVDMWWGVGMQM